VLRGLLSDKEEFLSGAGDVFMARPVRIEAVEALGLIGSAAEAATEKLGRMMSEDEEREVRAAAALAVFQIDEKRLADVMGVLLGLLDSEQRDGKGRALRGQQAAANALGKMGPAAKDALPGLTACLRAEDGLLRTYAVESIAAIGGRESLATITRVVEDDDDDLVREAAIDAIGVLGDRDSLPLLRSLLDDDGLFVSDAAAEAIKEIEAAPPATE
jgi:HEAT repeat protein